MYLSFNIISAAHLFVYILPFAKHKKLNVILIPQSFIKVTNGNFRFPKILPETFDKLVGMIYKQNRVCKKKFVEVKSC